MTTRPNLLFVFSDEQRRDAVGCAGNPDVQTPNVDRVAAEGVWCSRAYANTPLCTPSRGSLLTGTWPTRHRAWQDLPIDTTVPSLARALDAIGYECGYVGKWHLGGIPRSRFTPPGPERLGFDALWAAWNCGHSYLHGRWYEDDDEPIVADGRYEPEAHTDRALRWLAERSSEQPFCLFVSYGPPHDPYRPLPPGKEDLYDPEALTLRPNCPEEFPEASVEGLRQGLHRASVRTGLPERLFTYEFGVRRNLADYYTHVTALDEQFGRLVEHLRVHGALDDTIVVYSSDHGSMLGSHGLLWKQWPYEESIGVPLAIRAPGRVEPGTVSKLPIGIVDFAPTLLGLLDVPVPEAMQGRDLAAAITAGCGSARAVEPIYLSDAEAGGQGELQGLQPWRGLRDERWTYARNLDGPWLLFDNVDDPWQLRNLVDDPAHRDVRAELDQQLDRLSAAADDPLEPAADAIARHGLSAACTRRDEHMRSVFAEMAAAAEAGDAEALVRAQLRR